MLSGCTTTMLTSVSILAILCFMFSFRISLVSSFGLDTTDLRDIPIIANDEQLLDSYSPNMNSPNGGWFINSSIVPNQPTYTRIPASIPGELISDLYYNGIIPQDPYYNSNFTWIGSLYEGYNWTYYIQFYLNENMYTVPNTNLLLVIDGIKMVADISLNNHYLGYTNDQFLRYTYEVGSYLYTSPSILNTLTITFYPSKDPRNNENRFMAATGSWDWTMIVNTTTATGATTFSKGIWKSVYLLAVQPSYPTITYVIPHTYYASDNYPLLPLTDSTHDGFDVQVRTHFYVPSNVSSSTVTGTLTVTGNWTSSNNNNTITVPVTLSSGIDTNVTVWLHAPTGTQLWWPNDLGGQPLYNVTVTFTPTSSRSSSSISASRLIGFRLFTLVTGNDTDPSTLMNENGSGFFTMRYKINGANIWSRGANQIPMEQMEGRHNGTAMRRTVRSAAEGHFNTFRLWGGGEYPREVWYNACDQYGILIYHDFMYAQQGHSPQATPLQYNELVHNIRRISHHPSVVLFDGCNECGGGGIYTTFVIATLMQEDVSRVPWPSCPSSGWHSGVNRLWSLPNGQPFDSKPPAANAIIRKSSSVSSSAVALSIDNDPYAVRTFSLDNSSCTYVSNIDFSNGIVWTNTPADAPSDCCSTCIANSDACYVGTWYQGKCWWKNQTMTEKISFFSGTIACIPPNHTIPPLPPPSYPIETHGPYIEGNGWETCDCSEMDYKIDCTLRNFSSILPPDLGENSPTGTNYNGTFASEFGANVLQSFESFSGQLSTDQYGIHSPAFFQRNWPVDSFITTYSGNLIDRNTIGNATVFMSQIYAEFVAQCLQMKSNIANRRSTNSFGTIVWQYNEIWPTNSWGSIEYSSSPMNHPSDPSAYWSPGSLVGGRWKPLHYLYKRLLYTNQFLSCGNDARCFIRNDDPFDGVNLTIILSLYHLTTDTLTPLSVSTGIPLPPGPAQMSWGCMDTGFNSSNRYAITCLNNISTILSNNGCRNDGSDCILLMKGYNGSSTTSSTDESNEVLLIDTYELFTIPGNLVWPNQTNVPSIDSTVSNVMNTDGSYNITLSLAENSGSSTWLNALFVILTTRASGRFSDNFLTILSRTVNSSSYPLTLTFIPWEDFDYQVLVSTLRIEHGAMYFYARG